jgi:hypothetical protein
MPDYVEEEITPEEAARLRAEASGYEETPITVEEAKALGANPPQAPPPPPQGVDPGLWRSILLQFGSGGLKQGLDEVAGEIVQHAPGTIGRTGTYRKARDGVRAELDAAQENHPVPSFLANMAGDIGSDYVLSAFGVPVTNTAYQTSVGGLSGLLGSKSELTSDKRTMQDDARAALDTGVGAGLAYALPKFGGALARSGVGRTIGAKFRQALEGVAANTGRRVLQSGTDIAARTEPLAADAVLQALDDNAIRYLGTTQGAYKRLEELAAQRGANYAGILKELEDMGFHGPEVEDLAQRIAERAQQEARTIGSKQPARVARAAEDDLRNLARGGDALTRVQGPQVAALPLTEAEALKRKLQDEARWGLLSDTPVNEVKKGLASDVRQSVEDAVEQQGTQYPVGSAERDVAESFVPAKRQLANTLAARDLAEVGTSRIAKRGGTNLKDLIVAGATSGGSPAQLLLNQAGMSLLRSRGPSTLAQASYRLARGGANDTLTAGARAATHNPATIQALTDWLAGLGNEDDRKRHALLEYLQQQK